MKVHLFTPDHSVSKSTTIRRLTGRNRIFIRDTEQIHCIQPSQILFLEACGNYTQFHLKDGIKLTASKTLKHYQELLGEGFFRPHHSYLVCFSRVIKVNLRNGVQILVEDGTKIPVSKSSKSSVLNLFKN